MRMLSRCMLHILHVQDFHDNLYILLRGRKHFQLYSPADADKMYTQGTIARVHANGLVNYDEIGVTERGE